MRDEDAKDAPVKAKAVLVDPITWTVRWMNESALQESPDLAEGDAVGLPVERAMPMAEVLGVSEAMREVAATGVARHLRSDLVSTTKGSVLIATSVYRLPGGDLLVLTEHGWQARQDRTSGQTSRRPGRRGR